MVVRLQTTREHGRITGVRRTDKVDRSFFRTSDFVPKNKPKLRGLCQKGLVLMVPKTASQTVFQLVVAGCSSQGLFMRTRPRPLTKNASALCRDLHSGHRRRAHLHHVSGLPSASQYIQVRTSFPRS